MKTWLRNDQWVGFRNSIFTVSDGVTRVDLDFSASRDYENLTKGMNREHPHVFLRCMGGGSLRVQNGQIIVKKGDQTARVLPYAYQMRNIAEMIILNVQDADPDLEVQLGRVPVLKGLEINMNGHGGSDEVMQLVVGAVRRLAQRATSREIRAAGIVHFPSVPHVGQLSVDGMSFLLYPTREREIKIIVYNVEDPFDTPSGLRATIRGLPDDFLPDLYARMIAIGYGVMIAEGTQWTMTVPTGSRWGLP